MHRLTQWGWNAAFQADLDAISDITLSAARVASTSGTKYQIVGPTEPTWAECSGRLTARSRDPLALPAVGDWVAARLASTPPIIEAVLPRVSTLVRKRAGRVSEPQLLAANVDRVFIVTALGPDLNLRRIERYLAAVWDGGAEPVVVVNKTDLTEHRLDHDALESVTAHVPVVAISAANDEHLQTLAEWIEPAATVAFVGSSGVGKSTIINRLLGAQHLDTDAVRDGDHKGRHTTTRRELVRTPSGALLIDTPGMRELGLWDAEQGVSMAFEDVEAAAARCRFRDCMHAGEPGCGVARAVDEGALLAERVAAYQRLQRELDYQQRRVEQKATYDTKDRWKEIHKGKRQRRQLARKLGLDH